VRILRPGQARVAADLPARLVVEPERVVFVVEN
jgi:hypothetical protein